MPKRKSIEYDIEIRDAHTLFCETFFATTQRDILLAPYITHSEDISIFETGPNREFMCRVFGSSSPNIHKVNTFDSNGFRMIMRDSSVIASSIRDNRGTNVSKIYILYSGREDLDTIKTYASLRKEHDASVIVLALPNEHKEIQEYCGTKGYKFQGDRMFNCILHPHQDSNTGYHGYGLKRMAIEDMDIAVFNYVDKVSVYVLNDYYLDHCVYRHYDIKKSSQGEY